MKLLAFAVGALSTILIRPAFAQEDPSAAAQLRVLSFNILQGGGNASNVGFTPEEFGPSRLDEVAAVIQALDMDVVGVQEDSGSDALLEALGEPWTRAGNIYSRLPLKPLDPVGTVHLAQINFDGTSITIANAHWRPYPYTPYEIQKLMQMAHDAGDKFDLERDDLEQMMLAMYDKGPEPRGYAETVNALEPHLASGVPIVLTGDFNEPSHLDWTERSAEHGMDRWVDNPTGSPLRAKIRFAGSSWLARDGLVDAYRSVHRDEVAKPGITWTPAYPDGTKGRRDYGEQVLDRIDIVYVKKLRVMDASVVGENGEFSDVSLEDLGLGFAWPSDHRAVLAVLELK